MRAHHLTERPALDSHGQSVQIGSVLPRRYKSIFRNRGRSESGSDAADPADAAVLRQTCSYRDERKRENKLDIGPHFGHGQVVPRADIVIDTL